MYLIMYIINAYDNQILQNNPCFNLSKSRNNLFDNQGGKINKTEFFFTCRHTAFYENFNCSMYLTAVHIL